MLVARQSGDEPVTVQPRVTGFLISQCPVYKPPAPPRHQIAVRVRIIQLDSQIDRLERVEGLSAGLSPLPLQASLALFGGQHVDSVDQSLDRSLKVRRIINFKHQLPGRRRQHRTVYRKGEFSAQRSREVVAYVESCLRLELSQVLLKVRIDRIDCIEQIVHKRRRVLDYERSNDVRIGRDELQRSHWSRSRQPRSDPMIGRVEAEHRAIRRLALLVLYLDDEVLQVQNPELLHRRTLLTVAAMRANYVFKIGPNQESCPVVIDLREPRVERGLTEACMPRSRVLQQTHPRRSQQKITVDPRIQIGLFNFARRINIVNKSYRRCFLAGRSERGNLLLRVRSKRGRVFDGGQHERPIGLALRIQTGGDYDFVPEVVSKLHYFCDDLVPV